MLPMTELQFRTVSAALVYFSRLNQQFNLFWSSGRQVFCNRGSMLHSIYSIKEPFSKPGSQQEAVLNIKGSSLNARKTLAASNMVKIVLYVYQSLDYFRARKHTSMAV